MHGEERATLVRCSPPHTGNSIEELLRENVLPLSLRPALTDVSPRGQSRLHKFPISPTRTSAILDWHLKVTIMTKFVSMVKSEQQEHSRGGCPEARAVRSSCSGAPTPWLNKLLNTVIFTFSSLTDRPNHPILMVWTSSFTAFEISYPHPILPSCCAYCLGLHSSAELKMPLFRTLSSKLKRRRGTDSNDSRANGVLPAVDEAKHQPVVTGLPTTQPELSASPDPTGTGKPDLAHAHSLNGTVTPLESPAPNKESEVRPASRKDVESTFQQFAHLIHASRRPPPTQSGDGQYLEPEGQSGILADLRALGPSDLKTVRHILEDKASGKPQDDRKMHMEEVIQLVAALPHSSAQRVELTSAFLDELWNSLQHPPMSYLGDDFRYRSGDGSNNSYLFPKLGAANTPYARSVNPMTVQPDALPDPGLLFDTLLAREQFKPHPNKVSSIFFNWASLIIHGRL